MPKLFGDEEGPDLDVEIKTNNEYATHYNLWRQKEELNKLKTKYGDPLIANDDISEDESSSSDDEDEDGRELTAEFEKDFFKTLSCLKNKDPKIYDDKTVFFKEKQPDENEGAEEKRKKTKKNEPMFMKDYERKMLLEKGAKFEESDEEEEQENDPRAGSPTYVEEQRKLKESLKQALNDDGNEEENWGGLFMKRQKTKEEEEKEEADYKKWLKGNKDQLENKDEESALKPLKEYWSNPGLDDTETFLRDYLLNKRYLDKEDANHIPTYEEIIHDSDDGFSEDEKNIETQEEFEQKYNFRYEEPDQEFIKRYPRTMEHSVRKTDDRRKVKRQEIRERKEKEKKQKQEDLKQLKILKRKEIEEQIKKLKEITGNDDLAFQDADLDGDFDPEEHDRRMQELFNDNYYEGEEGDLKPEFSDLEEELGPWKGDNETHCEDDNFVMDCDYNPNEVQKEKEKKGKKKRNRPGKKPKNDEEEIPVDENDERYEEYMDELYKLDYEDMIGDTPCRFKYREVMPNDFGLTIEEILLAKDRELNRWCSLKKTTQYRPDHMEKYDVIAYQRKSKNEDLKKKILPSLYSEDLEQNLKELEKKQTLKSGSSENTYDDEVEENFDLEENSNEYENVNEKQNKNSKQNENKNNKQNDEIPENNENDDTLNNTTESVVDGNAKEKKSKKKNKKNVQNKEIVENDGNHNLTNEPTENKEPKESGKENKSKKKKTKKKLDNGCVEESAQNEIIPHENSPKKQKRKHSESEQIITETENNENISKDVQQNGTTNKLTRRQRKNLKKKQMPSETSTNTTETKTELKESKKNRKRKRSEQVTEDNESHVPKKKQKFKKDKKMNKNKIGAKDTVAISNSRLEAYGLNPKKFKNKLKYKNKTSNKQ